MKKLILSIVLVIVATVIFWLILPLAIVWGIIAKIYNKRFNEFSEWFMAWAVSIDQLGNVVSKELFNDVLISKSKHNFGNPDETISSVLGKNKINNSLTLLGKSLDWILDKLDPNHSVKSIEN